MPKPPIPLESADNSPNAIYRREFNKGMHARIQGLSSQENPHPSNTLKHVAWDKGWAQGNPVTLT